MRKNPYMNSAGVYPGVATMLAVSKDLAEKLLAMDKDPRDRMLGQYRKVNDVLQHVAFLSNFQNDERKKLAMANAMMWTLYERGIVSEAFARCFLPGSYYDDYFHACTVLSRDGTPDGMLTRNRPMKWLETELAQHWNKGAEEFSPENLHRLLKLHCAVGPNVVPDDILEPGSVDRLKALIAEHIVPTSPPEASKGPRWLMPSLQEHLDETGITDTDLPGTVEIAYVNSSFVTDTVSIQTKTVKKLHKKWAKFCTERNMDTECVEKVSMAKGPGKAK